MTRTRPYSARFGTSAGYVPRFRFPWEKREVPLGGVMSSRHGRSDSLAIINQPAVRADRQGCHQPIRRPLGCDQGCLSAGWGRDVRDVADLGCLSTGRNSYSD